MRVRAGTDSARGRASLSPISNTTPGSLRKRLFLPLCRRRLSEKLHHEIAKWSWRYQGRAMAAIGNGGKGGMGEQRVKGETLGKREKHIVLSPENQGWSCQRGQFGTQVALRHFLSCLPEDRKRS